jgi:hypothetical protein
MNKVITAAVLAATLSSSLNLHADTGFGIGVSYIFGSGMAVGVKVFADDKKSAFEASAGMDYMLKSGAWRPNIGASYLGDSNYGDLNAGWNLKYKIIDFGVGFGFSDTKEHKETPDPAPAPAVKSRPRMPAI